MKRDKKFWLLCAVLVAVISLVILSLSALYTAASTIRASGEPSALAKDDEAAATQKYSIYTVREHRGIIGIFSESGDLLEIIDTPIVALPQKDQEKLRIGITVSGERELSSLREDYS